MRQAEVKRKTNETEIALRIGLDGTGKCSINTGIGFFDHMMTLFAVHGLFDLEILCEALGDKAGIARYGSFYLPMDEAPAFVTLDISGRAYLVYDGGEMTPVVGSYDTELTEEFLRAFAFNAGITLHAKVLYGRNTHHKIEAIFKALAHALRLAVAKDSRVKGVPSSKGVL